MWKIKYFLFLDSDGFVIPINVQSLADKITYSSSLPQSQLKSSNMRFAAEQTFSRSTSKPNSFLTDFEGGSSFYYYISVFLSVND